MRLLIFSITLLATLTSGLDYCEGDKSHVGHCETLSYIDTTVTAVNPPSTAECQDACRTGVFGDAGDWGVDFRGKPDGYRQTMVGYPCTYSMGRAPSAPRDIYFSVDNQDIADIIDEVMTRFAPLHGGKASAEGTVRCDGYEAKWYVD